MRLLVFGKSGQVASALSDVATSDDIRFLGRQEADLLTKGVSAAEIARFKPDVVINAAAYTAVDNAESDLKNATALNKTAPAEMAEACKYAGAHFIHISTDYVFDGNGENHLSEAAPTNPLNVYGKTKLDGEDAILSANPDAIILRTSWVYSEHGGNFVKTMIRLGAERDQLSIVDDQVGGPTDAHAIATALLTIAGKKQRGAPGRGVYHYQGAPQVSWAGFARAIFDLSDIDVEVTPILTAEYPTPAKRPFHTVLDCARIERDFGIAQPDWRSGLRRVIAELKKKETAQ